eukprot:TRINITY_DN14859_c0_g1_i3.p1 TRINITY_DN14859_c0_g1~~TRINITY_DN14859_c0_g1_i3.p1  ORF type:complete len:165 (+),score=70.77 TRINITY_DN14859_c0_g1_i3:66-560(+)
MYVSYQYIFFVVLSFFFFFKQKTAYEMLRSLVGSEMCIRDRDTPEAAEWSENLLQEALKLVAVPCSLIDTEKPERVKKIRSDKEKPRHLRSILKTFWAGYDEGKVVCEDVEGTVSAEGGYIEMMSQVEMVVKIRAEGGKIVEISESKKISDKKWFQDDLSLIHI